MRALLLAAMLAGTAARAQDKAASPDDVKLVEVFLKRPLSELSPAAVEHFLAIDPETLPKKLRKPYQAKTLELYTLKHVAEGKKKGVIRTPDKDCVPPTDERSPDINALRMAGYMEISELDELCLEEKTHCSELEMMCEFSLQVITTKGTKGRVRHVMLYSEDPLAIYLALCHPPPGVGGQTNFFGANGPFCSH